MTATIPGAEILAKDIAEINDHLIREAVTGWSTEYIGEILERERVYGVTYSNYPPMGPIRAEDHYNVTYSPRIQFGPIEAPPTTLDAKVNRLGLNGVLTTVSYRTEDVDALGKPAIFRPHYHL